MKTSFSDKLEKTLTTTGVVYKMDKDAILEKKGDEDYTEEEKKIIDIVTIHDDTEPVGSFSFRAHKYPGDIDIMEKFEKCCSINDVRFSLVRKIQDIVKNVSSNEDFFIGDIKMGYDTRYSVYIGEIQGGEIVDYEEGIALKEIENLNNQGLLKRDTYKKMKSLIKVVPSKEEFVELYNMLRELQLLRWSEKEILQGYKDLIGNKRIWLYNAVIQGSIMKIDIWAPMENRYIEVTNWFLIIRKDLQGNAKYLGAELSNYIHGLVNDVIEFRKTNPMKSAKRLWNIAYYNGDIDLLIKLGPLFSTYSALLYQIKGDLEVLLGILKKVENAPIEYLRSEVEEFKTRLFNFDGLIQITEQEKEDILYFIDNILAENLSEESILALSYYIAPLINKLTDGYLSLNSIEPLEYINKIPTKEEIAPTCSTDYLK